MCSGTQRAIELGFGLPPLPEKAWRARAPPAGLGSHERRLSVQKIFGTFLFHQDCQFLFHHTVLSLIKRTRRVGIGRT